MAAGKKSPRPARGVHGGRYQ